jgi:hypothetical protein
MCRVSVLGLQVSRNQLGINRYEVSRFRVSRFQVFEFFILNPLTSKLYAKT